MHNAWRSLISNVSKSNCHRKHLSYMHFLYCHNLNHLHLSCDLMFVTRNNANTWIIIFYKNSLHNHIQHTCMMAFSEAYFVLCIQIPDEFINLKIQICFWALNSERDSLFFPVFIACCHVPAHWCISLHLTVISDTSIHNPLLRDGFESCCDIGLVSIRLLPHI